MLATLREHAPGERAPPSSPARRVGVRCHALSLGAAPTLSAPGGCRARGGGPVVAPGRCRRHVRRAARGLDQALPPLDADHDARVPHPYGDRRAVLRRRPNEPPAPRAARPTRQRPRGAASAVSTPARRRRRRQLASRRRSASAGLPSRRSAGAAQGAAGAPPPGGAAARSRRRRPGGAPPAAGGGPRGHARRRDQGRPPGTGLGEGALLRASGPRGVEADAPSSRRRA